VSAYTNAGLGAAYVFMLSGSTWTQLPKLVPPLALTRSSVGITGTTTIVGAHGTNSGQGAAYVFLSGHANGDACASTADCVSGFCVEGVCCDSACGTCRSCLATRKGSGSDGACGLVPVGGGDPACTGTVCTASGAGPNKCNGAGACGLPSPATSCALFACNAGATACNATCSADAACLATAYCAASTCVAKKSNGTACAAGNQCTSGNCVDGVCCSAACAGTCQACLLSATGQPDGTCAPVADGKDPSGDCASAGSTCTAASLTNHVCNGSGACRNNAISCAPYVCTADGKGCASSCAADADCGPNQWCTPANVCATKAARGTTCATDRECGSGFCVDAVCCNESCAGQCQACAEPGNVGTCIAAKGKPRSSRADCTGAGSPCYGQCDGSNISACAYVGAGKTCGTGCVDTAIARCDNAGSCLAPKSCDRNLACADATTCATTCARDADCAKGFACDTSSGACVPPVPTCTSDGLSSISADKSTTTPCAPFRCTTAGTCGNACATTDACAPGNQCDTTSTLCVSIPAAPSGSGGCNASGGGGGATAAALLALAGLLGLRRRRSARP
jgi:uncharacterized protein (TIGR03382 family)